MTTAESGADVDDSDIDLARVYGAVRGCPGVAALFSGAFREIASYLPGRPGRRIAGITVSSEQLEVHIVAFYGQPVAHIADQITSAVTPLLDGRAVRIVIEDIVLPGENVADDEPAGADDDQTSAAIGEAAPRNSPA